MCLHCIQTGQFILLYRSRLCDGKCGGKYCLIIYFFLPFVHLNCLLSPLQEAVLTNCSNDNFENGVHKWNMDQCSTRDSKHHRFLRLVQLFFEVCCHAMKLEPLASLNDDLRFLWVCTRAIVASLPSPMACQHFDKRSCRELVGRLKLAHVQKKPSLCLWR